MNHVENMKTRKIIWGRNLLLALFLGSQAYAQPNFQVLSNLWSLPTGSFSWLNTDGTQRGIAYSEVTNHVYVVSRAGGHNIYVLDGDNGSLVGQLDITGTGGGLAADGAINLVDCDDEGVIYACNLTTSSTNTSKPFVIFRWSADETGPPVIAYQGDPSGGNTIPGNLRVGDTFRVRGSGVNTEILCASRTGQLLYLFRTADGTNFTADKVTSDITAGDAGLGLAMASGTDFIWGKVAGVTRLRRMDLNTTALTAYSSNSITFGSTTVGVSYNPTRNLLAANDYSAHRVLLYDVSSPASPSLRDSQPLPAPAAANGNGTGCSDFGTNRLYALDSNNGIVGYELITVTTPLIRSEPVDVAILEGGFGTLSTTAVGPTNLVYLWYRTNDNALVLAATNNGVLNLTNVSLADQTGYQVVITNDFGAVTSAVAQVTVLPSVRTDAMTSLWKLGPGSRVYIASDNTQRGLAYNPATRHLLLVSRTPTNAVHIIDPTTGAHLGNMPVSGISGGTFAINLIGVADDGKIYACNLDTGGASKVYRWNTEAATPSLIYSNNPGLGRLGDTFTVRGAGSDTQIMLGTAATGTQLLLLDTFDGATFNEKVISTDAPAGFSRLGLTFGPTNTVFAKSTSFELLQLAFDKDALFSVSVSTNLPSTTSAYTNTGPIGYDPVNKLLGAVAVNETPDNLQFYDALNSTNGILLLDQEFFAADNANGNGTGAVAFDSVGKRVFALDSNNGLVALSYANVLTLRGQKIESDFVTTWFGLSQLQKSSAAEGPYSDEAGATSPHTNAITDKAFYRLAR
jgi:hypothetical protein